MKNSYQHKSRRRHRWFLGAVLIFVIAMAPPMSIPAQSEPFIYSDIRNDVLVRIRLGPNAQIAAEQLVANFNATLGSTELIFLPNSPFAYIGFREIHGIRRHDPGYEGEIIGTGHSVDTFLALLVYDNRRGGLSILQLSTLKTDPAIIQYFADIGIIEIPAGKTADDLVSQVWRKVKVLNPGDVENFQQEYHISSEELGEIEFKIKFRRQTPEYIPENDMMCDFEPNYIGLRFRSDPNRLVEISRRGTLYQLHILLIRLRCDLNDFLLNELFGDKKNEFDLVRQNLMEFYLEEVE